MKITLIMLLTASILVCMVGCLPVASNQEISASSDIIPTTTKYSYLDYPFVELLWEPVIGYDFSLENLLKNVDHVFTAKVTDVSFEIIEIDSRKIMYTAFELEVDTQYKGELPKIAYLRTSSGYPNMEYWEEQVAVGIANGYFDDGDTQIEYHNLIRYPDVGESYMFTLVEGKNGFLQFTWPFASSYIIDESQEIENPSAPCYATIKNYFENHNNED